MNAGRVLSLWGPVVGWAALIFAVSALPQAGAADPSRVPELMARKLAHVAEYAVLGWLVARALWRSGARGPRARAAALAFCALYAMSDEIHQSFVPGRYGKPRDVALDVLGAALALSFFHRTRAGTPVAAREGS